MWPRGRILQLATALGTWSPVMHQRAKNSRLQRLKRTPHQPKASTTQIGELPFMAHSGVCEKGNPKSDVVGPQGSCL